MCIVHFPIDSIGGFLEKMTDRDQFLQSVATASNDAMAVILGPFYDKMNDMEKRMMEMEKEIEDLKKRIPGKCGRRQCANSVATTKLCKTHIDEE